MAVGPGHPGTRVATGRRWPVDRTDLQEPCREAAADGRPDGKARATTASTRRQFGLELAGTAAAVFAAPAVLRGRNLNDKLNIAIIGAGGRGAANLDGVSSENIVALCDVYEPAVEQAGSLYPEGPTVPRLPQGLRPRQRVRRRRREHLRAHPRLRHPAGLAARQARLLREAADVQRLGGPGHPRGRRQGQGRHPDGHPDPRRRQLPPRRRADPDRRDRPGDRGPRLGRPGLGTAVGRGRPAEPRHRPRARSGPRARRRSPRGSTGTSGSAPRRPGRSTRSTGPGPSGTAGGTSATAR